MLATIIRIFDSLSRLGYKFQFMLGLMRKHIGWGLKVLLVVIIVTFVFFFGYNTLREQSQDATAIQIGEASIPFAEFRLFYDQQLENIRATLKEGQVPDFILKNIQSSTQRQLVTRALINQFARQLGLHVTDQELADHIVKEKDFDPVAYKNFIQNFHSRYGIAYEGLIREDLMVKDFQEWMQKAEPVDTVQTKPEWTFETVILTGEDKKKPAEEIQSLWHGGKEATPLLKKNKLTANTVGPLSLGDRPRLFQGQLNIDQYAEILALSRPKSAPAKPFQGGKSFLAIRLLEKKKASSKETRAAFPLFRVTDAWFDAFAAKTKVVSHITPDNL